ncbi:HdeD family acid-resistance protein [Phocaeicola sp.]|uniref:HdeD family acid-resistance protein n=1 Tax=Phocaeicola sp. TaxID=2773926 RepID=UPI003A92574E
MTTGTCLHGNCFKYWWIPLLVGILSILAGICCLVLPIESFVLLSVLFVCILLASGLFNIAFAVTNREWNDFWGWSLARGIIELLLGMWLYLLPPTHMLLSFSYIVGFWMLFHSVIGICESCGFSHYSFKKWRSLLGFNILSLVCAFLFLVTPVYGGIFILVYLTGAFCFYGVFRVVVAFKFKRFNDELEKMRHEEEKITDVDVIE